MHHSRVAGIALLRGAIAVPLARPAPPRSQAWYGLAKSNAALVRASILRHSVSPTPLSAVMVCTVRGCWRMGRVARAVKAADLLELVGALAPNQPHSWLIAACSGHPRPDEYRVC